MGDRPSVARLNNILLGMSICYDLRFPDLYRHYSDNKTSMCSAPASFTYPTGEAHWEVLCRSRAIDNRQFILAPNQVGVGAGGILSYGNSMVVDPWGRILVRGDSSSEGVYHATLDFSETGFELN